MKHTQLEYIDICDAQGQPTGVRCPRDQVHAQGLWHRTAHTWLMNETGCVLLQKRAQNKENYPGCWDISSAGHISTGESSREGAIRELREELGLSISVEQLHFLGESHGELILQNGAYIDREYHDIFWVPLDTSSFNTFHFDDGEVEDVRWVDSQTWEKEMEMRPLEFAPHPEEYAMVLNFLRNEYPTHLLRKKRAPLQ